MIALVTGSTGFIGSHLCRALLEDGHQVRAFHRPSSKLKALEGLAVEHAVGDITDLPSLEKAMRGVEVVFHTAAMLGRPSRPEEMYAVTVQGTRNVLKAAVQAGVRRLIHTSSVAALGVPVSTTTRQQQMLMDERSAWNYHPEWWRYGYAKHLAEQEVQQAVAQGLDAVIVNPAVVLGPGDLNRISGDSLIQVARGRVPVAVTGGINVVHIRDVVRGHLAALVSGRRGERYILGGENLSIISFLRLASEAAGVRSPALVLPGRLVRRLARPVSMAARWLPLPISGELLRQAGYYFYYDTLKARIELGLEHTLPARQAITDALDWYKQQNMI